MEQHLRGMSELLPSQSLEETSCYRSKTELLRDYEISIKFLSLGCIVRIGCKEVAFTSIQQAMQEVNEYVTNPKMLADKYNKLFNEQ